VGKFVVPHSPPFKVGYNEIDWSPPFKVGAVEISAIQRLKIPVETENHPNGEPFINNAIHSLFNA